MLANNLVWFLIFLMAALVMVIAVPRERIIRLLPFGFWAGFLLAMLIQMVAVWGLKLWSFNYLAFFSYRGIPLFVALAWMPTIIVFAHFIELARSRGLVLYVLGFAGVSTLVEYLTVLYGYRQYLNWSIYLTFVLAVVVHSLLAVFLLKRIEVRNTE